MEEVLRELAVTDERKLCNILQNCTKLQFSITCSLQADDPAWLGVAPTPVLRLEGQPHSSCTSAFLLNIDHLSLVSQV
jgi:hypothetical protein